MLSHPPAGRTEVRWAAMVERRAGGQEGIGYAYVIEKESQKRCDRSKENTECPAEAPAGAFIFIFCCNRE